MLPIPRNFLAPHPLLTDPGVSQTERFLPSVDPTRIRIDDRNMPELLGFILRLSKRIAYYTTDTDPETAERIVLTRGWLKFFEGSQPFLLASISQTDLNGIEKAYNQRLEEIRRDPSAEGLQVWVSYSHSEIIKLVLTWHERLRQEKISLNPKFDSLIVNQLRDPLKAYIALLNGADRWYCTGQYAFNSLSIIAVWDLDLTDLYTTDESFHTIPDYYERIRSLVDQLDEVFSAFLHVSRQLIALIPEAFTESLIPLQKEHQQNHAPHLGLLFAFLELFNLFRNDLNNISQQHLEFFYQKVLRIKPLPATPDSVHLILETARTVETPYLVKKGTPLLGGKDSNEADIRFETDNEIIIDKAQVKELKTLYLNPILVGNKTFVENVYMAPVANSRDGKGVKFPDPKAVQWPTLGRKESPLRLQENLQKPEEDTAVPYPFARLGWIFASPVLLLNEGKRTVTITINATFDNDETNTLETLAIENLTTRIAPIVEKALDVSFSGKKEWINPSETKITLAGLDTTTIAIIIFATLNDKLPPITFLDKAAWKTKENDYRPDFPSVRVLLNPSFFIAETDDNASSGCGLQAPKPSGGNVSLYHYLRGLKIANTQISVEVCGVKNLIVQNDENLQDVNSPIYPFSPRPNIPDFSIINKPDQSQSDPTPKPIVLASVAVIPNPEEKNKISQTEKENKLLSGPNFYIGSQEIFLKNWQEVAINICWKDKPDNLDEYYEAYGYSKLNTKERTFEKNFGLRISALTEKIWHKSPKQKKLFVNDTPKKLTCSSTLSCSDQQYFTINRSDISDNLAVAPTDEFKKLFTGLTVDTRFGFLRFTLENQDFLHKDYPIILARQMMALGKYPTDFILNATYLRNMEGDVFTFAHPSRNVGELDEAIEAALTAISEASTRINETIDELTPISIPTDPNPNEAELIKAKEEATLEKADSTKHAIESSAQAVNSLEQAKTTFLEYIGILRELRRNPGQAKVMIPNEPYTPIIKEISVDYTATASLSDIEFVHLYPYEGTYKKETLKRIEAVKSINELPTLLPTFMDEGTLYIGLSDLRPNGTLNLLFQLAEITADSELDKVEVLWSYLLNNTWKPLAPLTNILNDGTDGLTRSGIVKIALPHNIPQSLADIATDPAQKTTILPPDSYWLRAAVHCNARATANVIGIHTQAVKATFVPTPASDLNRLNKALPAESITKLLEANSSISAIQQPYASFGGKPTEQTTNLYRRIGEQLRHKGRAINLFDYERLTLEAFPLLFRAKCISHTLGLPASSQIDCQPAEDSQKPKNEAGETCNSGPFRQDLEIAPGFVLLAVIPNVGQLQPADRYEPRVPMGVLNDIETFLQKRASPFVRLKAMNPRYEQVNVTIGVRLHDGLDTKFYEGQLKEDIRLFFSPWVTGNLTRLAFGVSVRYSDLVLFVEKLSYVDYITDLTFAHEQQGHISAPVQQISPRTARSILTAGTITVKTEQPKCL